MALQKKFITVFACVLSASAFFACSESKLDGSPTGTVDANASSSSTSDVGTCNVSNINDIKFVAAENMYYRCDGLTWVQQSSSSVASSSSNTSGVNVFATLEDFPNCTASRENQLAVVSTTNTPYMCTEGRWVVYGTSSISSSSSNVASSSSGTKQSSSSVIVSSSSSTPTLSSSSTPIEDPSSSSIASSSSVLVSSSSSAECGDEDKVWKAEGGKYYECIDGEWVEGSSSSVESSSSSTSSSSVEKLAWDYLNQDMLVAGKYGELLDSRDNQVYKTVTIGSQTWMAENLNYAYKGVKYNYDGYTTDSTSWCYDNETSNCDKYGRLYTWSAVMDSAAQFSVNAGTKCGYGKTCTPNSPHRGICPAGWHVPTNEEYSTLYTYIGGSGTAGSLLRSTSDWYDSGYSSDKYGFSVLPAGNEYDRGNFGDGGVYTNLWSASEYNSGLVWIQSFYEYKASVDPSNTLKFYGQSLRCLKDSPDQGGEISSSSIDASSSSSSAPTEDPGSTPAAIKPSGYYSNSSNCPAGLTCKYATTTDYLNPGKTYGEILDTRDGQVYKTIVICDKNDENCQTWMAQNLNYAPTNVSSMGSYAWSGCYVDESANCSKYGRLYTWEVAMDDAACAYGKTCNASLKPATPVRGVCPQGWHLPSHYEFEQLINFIDPTFGYSHTDDAYSSTAGQYLKSLSGWNSSGNGSDAYGFSALPGGDRNNTDSFFNEGYRAYFWSSGEFNSDNAFYLSLDYDYDNAGFVWLGKNYARSVRCLKD